MGAIRQRRCLLAANSAVLLAVSCAAGLLPAAQRVARAQAEAGAMGASDFLDRYQRALRDLEKTYRDVRIEFSLWKRSPIRDSPDGPVSFQERTFPPVSYVCSAGCEEVHGRRDVPSFMENAIVLTSRYGFRVHRGKPDGPFALVTLDEPRALESALEDHRAVKSAPYSPPMCPDFPGWLSSPYFKIKYTSRLSEGGGSLIKATFEYTPPGMQKVRAEGWFSVDPSALWVLRGYDIEMGRPDRGMGRIRGSVTYTQQSGPRVPAEIDHTYVSWVKNHIDSKDHTFHYKYTISKFLLTPTDPAHFTLAAYGLGDYERTLVQAESRATYRTAIVAGAAFLASLVLFWIGRRFHKRRKLARTGTLPDPPAGSPPAETPG